MQAGSLGALADAFEHELGRHARASRAQVAQRLRAPGGLEALLEEEKALWSAIARAAPPPARALAQARLEGAEALRAVARCLAPLAGEPERVRRLSRRILWKEALRYFVDEKRDAFVSLQGRL